MTREFFTGLSPDKQVVVDLHDQQASGRKGDSGSLRQIIGTMTRRPGTESRDLPEVSWRGVWQCPFAEARPTRVEHIVLLNKRRKRWRYEVEGDMMVLGAAREELA